MGVHLFDLYGDPERRGREAVRARYDCLFRSCLALGLKTERYMYSIINLGNAAVLRLRLVRGQRRKV